VLLPLSLMQRAAPIGVALLAAFVFGLTIGIKWHAGQVAKDQVRALEAVRENESELQRIANRAGDHHAQNITAQSTTAAQINAALPAALGGLQCPVSSAAVRLFNASTNLPTPARPATEFKATSTPIAAPASLPAVGADDVGVEAAVIIARAIKNQAEVCVPNALQLQDLQDWYAQLLSRVNEDGAP